MTIDRVLHAFRSGKMDFYSSSYFATMANAPFLYKEGAVVGYGKTEGGKYVVVDITRARSGIRNWSFGQPDEKGCVTFDETIYEPYIISRPLVPPSKCQISETEFERDPTYLTYWLNFYDDGTPKYVNPNSEPNCRPVTTAEVGTEIVPDPMTSVPGYRFNFIHHTIRPENTLPICNGFARFPRILDNCLYVQNIYKHYQDPSARNRGMVLIDFTKVGGCQFVKMSQCKISSIGTVTIPSDMYNPATQSLIVVLGGRILTHDKYNSIGRMIVFGNRATNPMMLLDEKICTGELTTGKTWVMTAEVDLEKTILDTNSFFVVVNKPNLQIVVHQMWWETSNPVNPHPPITVDSFAKAARTQFDQVANGILVDEVTNSVYDYAREEHTVTFYAESSEPISWKTATVTVKPERPLVILKSSKDNFMSARGMLFTKPTDIAKEDTILWPKFAIYDFVFRG